MKIRTMTASERAEERKIWKPKFAIFPIKVDDGDWRWLEWVLVREVVTGEFPTSRLINQHKATDKPDFWPPYPWLPGDLCTSNEGKEKRRKNRDRPEFPKSTISKG
jgi:hypothetical protein